MDLIESIVADLKTFKKYQDEVEKERDDREATEKKERSALRELNNLYLKAQAAQEDDWRLQNHENGVKVSSLEKANHQMEEKILRLEGSLQRKKEESKEANLKQKELTAKLEQLKAQHQTEVAALKSQLKEANHCKDDYSRTMESLKCEKEKLSTNMKEGAERHRHESGKLKNDLHEAQLQNASLEKRLKMIEAREKSLADEIGVKHKLTAELTSQILAMEERSSQLSTENRGLVDRLSKEERKWQKEMKKADDERNGLVAEKTKLEEKLRRKEKSMQERMEDVESANSQLAIEKRKIEREGNQKMVELQTLIENIEAELVRANAKIEASEEMMSSQEKHYKKQLEETESRRCKLQIESDKLRSELKLVREKADKRVQLVEEQKQKVTTELKKLRIDMKESHKEAEMTIKKLETDAANHRAEHVQLVQSCEAKEPIIEEQTQQLQEQKTNIGMLQERIKVLEKQLSETIVGKHDQLYQERKQMKHDEEEKLSGLLEEKVALEARLHQAEGNLREAQHQKGSLEKRMTKQVEMLRKSQESAENESNALKRDLQDKAQQHKKLLLINCELEEKVKTLEKTGEELQQKLKSRDFEIKEVMVKNMDLRTDLKHARNKTSNEVVLCKSELREIKRRLQDTEEELGVVKHSEENLQARVAEDQERWARREEKLQKELEKLQEMNRHLNDVVQESRSDHEDEQRQLTSDLEEARERMEGALQKMEGLEQDLGERSREWEKEKEEEERRHEQEINNLMEENAALHGRLTAQAMENTTRLAAAEQSLLIAKNEIRVLQYKLESVTEEEKVGSSGDDGTEQNHVLQNENSILHAKLEDIERDNARKVSELEEIVAQTRNARQGLEAEVSELKSSQRRLEEEVSRLQRELEEREENSRAEMERLQNEKKLLQSTLSNSKGQSSSEVALLRLEIDTLQQGSQKTDDARERAEQSLKRLKHEYEALKRINENHKLEVENLQLEMEHRERENAQEKDESDQEVKRLQRKLEEVKRTNEELEKVKWTNESQGLEMQRLQQAEDCRERERMRRQEAEEEMKRMKQELEQVKRTNDGLEQVKRTNEHLRQEVKQLQQEIEQRESEMKEERKLGEQQVNLVKMELEQVKRSSDGLEKVKGTNERLQQEVKQLQQEIEDREKEIMKQREQGEQEVKRVKMELEEVKRTNDRLEQAKQTSEKYKREMKGRESELFQVNEAKCSLESEVERLKKAEKELKEQLAELEMAQDDERQRMEEEVARYKEDNQGLKVACESLQGQSSETATLRSELETMKRRQGEKEKTIAELKTAEQGLKNHLDDALVKLTQETEMWQKRVAGLEKEKLDLQKSSQEGEALKKELQEVGGQLETLRRNYDSLEDKETATMRQLRAAEADLSRERDGHSIERRKFTLEIAKLKNEMDSLTSENKSLISERSAIQAKATEFTSVNKEKEEVQTRAQKLENDLKQTSDVAKGQEKMISNLQSMCTMLEEQVTDLEALSGRLEMNLLETVKKNEDSEKQRMTEKETQRKMLDEVKGDLEQTTVRVRDLEKREADLMKIREEESKAFEEAAHQHDEEVEDLNRDIEHWRQQGQNYKEQALQLAEQLAEMQTNCASMERDLRALKESIINERKDSDHLSGELASIVDKFEQTKATNFKLTSCLEKAIETGQELKGAKNDLESEVNNLQSNYTVEKVKLRGMMSQQAKLIDFLQAKMEEPPKKKKKKLFGKSGKDKAENIVLPLPYKELQDLLEYEQAKNAGLERCLEETRKELYAAKSGTLKSQSAQSISHLSLASDVSMSSAMSDASTVLSAIVLSPSNQPSPNSLSAQGASNHTHGKRKKVSQNPQAAKRVKERMKHNIPHRFTNILNMKPTICAVCVDTVHFGRHASKCQECHRVCHPKCASALPHTCGLPFQFMQHFSEALHHQSDSPVSTLNSSTESSTVMKSKGWMKVQGSVELGWEKKWVTLDGTQILIFNREHIRESSRPWKSFSLQPKEGWVSIHARVIPAELPNTVPSDLPFVIKLEHHATSQPCFPSKESVLYLMAPTFEEKQRWVGVLENVVALNGYGAAEVKKQSASVSTNRLLNLEGDNKLDINCTIVLNHEILLLGCDEGLYVMNLEKLNSPLSHLSKVGSIYQMKLVPRLGIVIIIAGELRKLGFIDVEHLTRQAKEASQKDTAVKCSPILSIEACHLFAIDEIHNTTYLCAAQPQKISILKYEANKFVLKKEIPTAEPCSCLIFSKTGLLIAGMDRFYEIELKTFQTDEFLDSSHGSLAHSGTDIDTFPVAALLVSTPGEPEEFLLCFHEFAVFVNAKGTRTRDADLEWSRLPLSVSYRQPYLYITHFNCLEVLEIKSFAEKDRPQAHTLMELPNPRFTGFARTEGAVYVTSIHSQKAELICLKGNLADSPPGQQDVSSTDNNEDTPKSANSSASREDSRISLKRTLDEPSEASRSKLSRTSTTTSHHDSFRAAIAASNPLPSYPQTHRNTSSSEDEVKADCGSVRMFSGRSNRDRRLKQAKH